MFLRQRSYQKELLDAEDIPFDHIKQNMKELNFINTWLGGHNITISGLKRFLSRKKQNQWHICEIGCGGGDNLRAIEHWCTKNNISVCFTGIDIKQECIDYARETTEADNYRWIVSDYRLIDFEHKPDIIFSSLFCHHFAEDELQQMMQWMHANSSSGFFINDLHRHSVAWASIKLLTQLFSNSYLVKNDAPLSVKRGFSRKDLTYIMQRSGIGDYSIQWKWAFRWLVTVQ